MSEVDSALLVGIALGLFLGCPAAFLAGATICRRRRDVRADVPRFEYELDLAPSECRSQR